MKPYNKERGRGEKGRGGGETQQFILSRSTGSTLATKHSCIRNLPQVIVQADLHYRAASFFPRNLEGYVLFSTQYSKPQRNFENLHDLLWKRINDT